MTTKRLAIVAVVLLAVILVLGVVAFVIWRGDVAQAEFEELFDECTAARGLDDVTPLTPGYDGVEYAEQLASCSDQARRLADQ